MNRKNDFVKHLNLQTGVIEYNDFDIDESIPFKDQKYSYKEDILQISYGDRFILDVGWYPEFNPEGHFITVVVLDKDWLNLASKLECRTLSELKEAIESSAKLIQSQLRIKDLPYRDVKFEKID